MCLSAQPRRSYVSDSHSTLDILIKPTWTKMSITTDAILSTIERKKSMSKLIYPDDLKKDVR